jgi:osmoprotectant transport system substrate-binding protein
MDRTKTVAGVILASLLLGACSRGPHLVVGSKNFTEQVLLGEILAQQIERRLHVTVDHKLDLGGTLLTHEALVKGAIDLYPEYTGTALTAILKEPPSRDPAAVWERVHTVYRDRWQLVWFPPLGFNNTFAMMIRGDTARKNQLQTISDAARLRAWRLGVGYEFKSRADGLDGLVSTYGLRLAGSPVSMDLGLLYPALERASVDMIAANSTDGLAATLDVKVLDDDRHYFPPYQCAAVVRTKALTHFPGLRGALEELSAKITDQTMRRLNYEVDGKHRSVVQVAAEFLRGLPR